METFGLLGFLLAALAFIQITIMNRKLNYPHLAILRTLLEVGDSYEQCLLVSSCSKQRLHFF